MKRNIILAKKLLAQAEILIKSSVRNPKVKAGAGAGVLVTSTFEANNYIGIQVVIREGTPISVSFSNTHNTSVKYGDVTFDGYNSVNGVSDAFINEDKDDFLEFVQGNFGAQILDDIKATIDYVDGAIKDGKYKFFVDIELMGDIKFVDNAGYSGRGVLKKNDYVGGRGFSEEIADVTDVDLSIKISSDNGSRDDAQAIEDYVYEALTGKIEYMLSAVAFDLTDEGAYAYNKATGSIEEEEDY